MFFFFFQFKSNERRKSVNSNNNNKNSNGFTRSEIILFVLHIYIKQTSIWKSLRIYYIR